MFASQGTLSLVFAPSGNGERIREDVTTPPFTMISLYSGAGGLDLGFIRAGFSPLWAIDDNQSAVDTYNSNIGPHAVCGDVLTVDPPGDLFPDLVIGGPPCQGFSVAGRMDPNDPRSRHVNHFFDVVERANPRGFVMENVKSLGANPRWEAVRAELRRRATALGYSHRLFLLNAQDFGVPQSRERMFFVGIRDGEIPSPVPTTRQLPPTVRQAFSELPDYGSPGNDSRCVAKIVPAKSPIMRPTAFHGSLLFNGSGRPLKLDAPAKTLPASMGGNATPIIDQHELATGAHPWVVDYHQRLADGGSPLKRAPKRLRRITVEEASAIQTFPREWCFQGTRNAQFKQIGNAVPPNLAEAVASSIRAALEVVDRACETDALEKVAGITV